MWPLHRVQLLFVMNQNAVITSTAWLTILHLCGVQRSPFYNSLRNVFDTQAWVLVAYAAQLVEGAMHGEGSLWQTLGETLC